MRPFHLAIPVHDLELARGFYVDRLGCSVGRSAARWIDFNLYGHQLSVHQVDGAGAVAGHNPVDGDRVPVPHFGVILTPAQFAQLRDRLVGLDTEFIIAPKVRFEGEPGEQGTLFLADPSGNALEFKSFGDDSAIFAR